MDVDYPEVTRVIVFGVLVVRAPGTRVKTTKSARNPSPSPKFRKIPPKTPNVENLSRGDPKIQSNNNTFHATYTLIPSKIFGGFILSI
jgi:hypothetical protein